MEMNLHFKQKTIDQFYLSFERCLLLKEHLASASGTECAFSMTGHVKKGPTKVKPAQHILSPPRLSSVPISTSSDLVSRTQTILRSAIYSTLALARLPGLQEHAPLPAHSCFLFDSHTCKPPRNPLLG